jgi:hypothetical protein
VLLEPFHLFRKREPIGRHFLERRLRGGVTRLRGILFSGDSFRDMGLAAARAPHLTQSPKGIANLTAPSYECTSILLPCL